MKARKLYIAITLLVLALSGAWCAYILQNKNEGRTVMISQNGKELYRIDLDREKDRTIEVEYEGRKNVIEIKDGRIHMMSADCPDHICIETGWLTDGKPIVCLPNRLVIEFENSELDGTAG